MAHVKYEVNTRRDVARRECEMRRVALTFHWKSSALVK
jgi:hypothetical protein